MQQLRSIKTSRRAGSVPRGIILNGIGSPTELCRSDNVLVCRIVGPPTPHLLQLQAVAVCTLQSIEHRFQNQTHRWISPAALQSRVSSSYLVVDAGGTSL